MEGTQAVMGQDAKAWDMLSEEKARKMAEEEARKRGKMAVFITNND